MQFCFLLPYKHNSTEGQQEVRDTKFVFRFFFSDPLQRDINQVHLPATQRLLAAYHTPEQRGRSLQLPRYRFEVANYYTRSVAISFPALCQWKTTAGGEDSG